MSITVIVALSIFAVLFVIGLIYLFREICLVVKEGLEYERIRRELEKRGKH